MTLIGGNNPNVNKLEDTHTPLGANGESVNYILEKFDLKGLEYISGILFVPNEKYPEIAAFMHPYGEFKVKVEHWLQTGEL